MTKSAVDYIRSKGIVVHSGYGVATQTASATPKKPADIKDLIDRCSAQEVMSVVTSYDSIGSDQGVEVFILLKTGVMIQFKDCQIDA